MGTMITASIATSTDNGNHHGHCSRCGKVWTLDTAQGVCQWCDRQARRLTSQRQARRSKTTYRKRQAPDNASGYDQLPEPHLTYYNVASRYSHKALASDKGDLLHDIIITLADVASHKQLTKPAMYRIASNTVADYWRSHYKYTNGLTCGSCSKAQRRECKEHWLYGKCPKAIKLEYLSKPVIGTDGELTELGELIADDNAIDLDAWLDYKTFMLGCNSRLLAIAMKLRDGIPLDHKAQEYLRRFRQREQKKLF